MFSIAKTYGDPEKPGGFFKFFDADWDETALGAKPKARAVDLMQKNRDGSLLEERVYRVEKGAEYWGCPRNPHWRDALKRMVSAAIPLGLDGFIALFPQRFDCTCEHCQAGLKEWLASRYDAKQIKKGFGIADLAGHRFEKINGWYEPDQASPLALECLKFTQATLKDCFDEVFIKHGRGLKPDLILGQWNHIYRSSYDGPGQLSGTFAQLNADERCVLPTERWSEGEDFVWYSIGNWRMYDDPKNRRFGNFILERKYLYEAGGGKPSAIKADDPVRVRLYIAECVANGGFAYPRGPDYRDAATREAVRTYFEFLHQHEALYRSVEPYAEAALAWNRRAVHRGDTRHLEDFKRLGALLAKNHVLFDVVLDEEIGATRLARYQSVFLPDTADLTDEQRTDLEAFIQGGGKAIVCADTRRKAHPIARAIGLPSSRLQTIVPACYEDFRPHLDEWLPARSTVIAPDSVGFTCFQQSGGPLRKSGSDARRPKRLIVHLVNYLRDRRPLRGVRGAVLERPIPQEHLVVKLRLPSGLKARSVKLLSPEQPKERKLRDDQDGVTLTFEVPEIFVYAVAAIELK